MIIGTTLIVFIWVLFIGMGLPLWAGIVLTVLGAILILFGFLFFVYFFNIDMKLLAHMQDFLLARADKKSKNKKRKV